MNHQIKTIRVYDVTPETEGYRILVDRLWPRGLRKEALAPFTWKKDIAPSNDLRKWFGHDPDRFEEFALRYRKELDDNPCADAFVKEVENTLRDQDVLLIYAAKNKEGNQAVVLKTWLQGKLG